MRERGIGHDRAEVAGASAHENQSPRRALTPVLRPTPSGGACRLEVSSRYRCTARGSPRSLRYWVSPPRQSSRCADARARSPCRDRRSRRVPPTPARSAKTLPAPSSAPQAVRPLVGAHAVEPAASISPVQVHGGRSAAGERFQGVGDAEALPADGIHEVAAAQRASVRPVRGALQRNGEHAAVRMVAFPAQSATAARRGVDRDPNRRWFMTEPAPRTWVAHLASRQCRAHRVRRRYQRGQEAAGRGGNAASSGPRLRLLRRAGA